MVIQHKIKHLYFFLILIYELLCYIENSSCVTFNTQKNKLANNTVIVFII